MSKHPLIVDTKYGEETLYSHCVRLSKRNNSLLYKLESYLGQKLTDNHELSEIRDTILTVSADISKLHHNIRVGEDDEGLQ